ncbi:hypothetical protein [Winogradskyella sp. A3E31]|uniref:hypothetical protein n=1 Tax=Winogradskyella sp. A3E31 TaxID=3349637 RepID=UPI00398B1D79
MKKLLILLFLIPLLSFNSNQSEISIIGKWQGVDEARELGYMIFDNDGYATIEIEGVVYGGKEFEINGKTGSMTYSINSDIEPVQIDLIMTIMDSINQMNMLFIAKFKDKNTMILASNFNSERPFEFNSDNSITLIRIE